MWLSDVESRTGPGFFRRRQLIVLGSDITALAVVRSAYHLGVLSVLVDNRAGIATASRLAHADVHPGLRPAELVPRIRELARRAPSALLATSDVWLRAVVAHRAELSVNGMEILHPDNARLEICLDKGRFARWCEQHWLPAPRPYGISANANLELERAGAAPSAAESLLGRQLQQFSVGAAVSAPAMMTIVTRKVRPLPDACDAGSLVEATEQSDVERLAQRALSALDYHGIAEVEILRDEDSGELFVIEVNARPWKHFAIAAARGRDLLAFVLERRATARPSPTVSDDRRAVWLDFRHDLRVCFGTRGLVRTGRLGLWAYVRSIARANVFARWTLSDPLPACRDFRARVQSALSRKLRLH